MKTTITKKVEVNIKSILIDIALRYIGDSEDDDVPSDAPMLNGSVWKAKVDIGTGKIENWPAGRSLNLWAKVCDAGSYTLYDENDNVVLAINEGYVPNGIVPGECGDYIDLKIDVEGVITNWPENPDISEFMELED